MGVLDGELGEEGELGAEGELGDESVDGVVELVELGEDGEELDVDEEESPLGLPVESETVVLDVLSDPCENVPRLADWSRVSSSAWLLNTRPLGTAKLPFPPPLPPDPDRPTSGRVVAVDADVDFGSRSTLGVELASPLLLELFGAESETTTLDAFPEPVEALEPSTAGAEGLASEAGFVVVLLPFEVVPSADLSEPVFAWRTARRFPSAAAAAPSDWPKLPFGARTHNKLMV